MTLRIGSAQLNAEIMPYGARLHQVWLERAGLVAGLPTRAAYQNDTSYRGAVVGPVAGRLSGAQAMIGDMLWRFDPNEGTQLLHGGAAGFHARDWQIADQGPEHVTFALDLGHCEGGFPGRRRVEARYAVNGLTLRLDLAARTDRPTLMNLAPHVYWNLTGGADLTGHHLRVAADHMLPLDARLCPVGPPVPVSGDLDLRAGRLLSAGPGYDDCFCLSAAPEALRPVAWLSAPGAPALELATTEPGLQVYDAAPTRYGIALESQCWPDAPNQPGYPSILLTPQDGTRVQSTEWRFTLPKEN
ncbi:MAG: galactose mutarotase [Rhodobacteraceae bacterium]|nr:MAG: galactose mutarotase [Paracoccaceae bacterium]